MRRHQTPPTVCLPTQPCDSAQDPELNGAAQCKVLSFPALGQSSKRLTTLTPREAAVIELAHLHNSEIAALLGISPKTVKTLMNRAFMRLGAETRTQAVLLWRDRRAA